MELWGTMKQNICNMRTSKREENKKGRESIYKAKMTENFRNLEREINIQIHEAKRISQQAEFMQSYTETLLDSKNKQTNKNNVTKIIKKLQVQN